MRIALLEALGPGGAMTATELGECIGESPTTCSFHLRQLAKYGFVEEAGGGKGRARPWRMTSMDLRIKAARGDAESEIAAGTVGRMVRERQFSRYWTWMETRATYPREWQGAAPQSEYVYYLTAGELKQLTGELENLLADRFADRLTDPSKRPPGAAPVEVVTLAYPIGLPEGGQGGQGGPGGQGGDGGTPDAVS